MKKPPTLVLEVVAYSGRVEVNHRGDIRLLDAPKWEGMTAELDVPPGRYRAELRFVPIAEPDDGDAMERP